jgi:hypothetical protein
VNEFSLSLPAAAVALYCLVRGVADLKAGRTRWGIAGLAAAAAMLLVATDSSITIQQIQVDESR